MLSLRRFGQNKMKNRCLIERTKSRLTPQLVLDVVETVAFALINALKFVRIIYIGGHSNRSCSLFLEGREVVT